MSFNQAPMKGIGTPTKGTKSSPRNPMFLRALLVWLVMVSYLNRPIAFSTGWGRVRSIK